MATVYRYSTHFHAPSISDNPCRLFSEVEAGQDKYRDIVSIVVDRDTYHEISPQITRYAEDIQSYLGSTRTSILVVDAGTSPAQIAAQNEKLYYEGDGDK